uniref:Uncharacterized protein n=1 Tax=Moniliophthora roreri TaxID=221103 RepID=A0A0W0G9A6_MONRR
MHANRPPSSLPSFPAIPSRSKDLVPSSPTPMPAKPVSRIRRVMRFRNVFGRTRSSSSEDEIDESTLTMDAPTRAHDTSGSDHSRDSDGNTVEQNTNSAPITPPPQRPPPRRAVRPRAADIFEGGRRLDSGTERDWDLEEMIEGSEGVDNREGELPKYDKAGRPPKYGELADMGVGRRVAEPPARTQPSTEYPPRTPPPRYSSEFTLVIPTCS